MPCSLVMLDATAWFSITVFLLDALFYAVVVEVILDRIVAVWHHLRARPPKA